MFGVPRGTERDLRSDEGADFWGDEEVDALTAPDLAHTVSSLDIIKDPKVRFESNFGSEVCYLSVVTECHVLSECECGDCS